VSARAFAAKGGLVTAPSIIDTINQRTMRSAEAVARYSRSDDVWPSERAMYERVRHEVRGGAILDLGVGGGRTVAPLLELSTDYVGIDYTREMVAACARRFPATRFEWGDARELSRFAADHFALVVFSCNGLGMVGHEDRLKILAEVRRVLRPGGAFLFSTHNRDSADHDEGFVWPTFERARDPLRLAVRAARFAVQAATAVVNHRRYRRHEIRTADYSIINDRCHGHGTMLYYISLSKQREQLERAGFQPHAEAYDLAGERVIDASTDGSLAWLARK
jgi:SAM-dependent methyltransferase